MHRRRLGAADDVAAAQTLIRSQVEAFSHDDAATAYSCAAPAIHDMFPQADICLGMVQHSYTPVYRHESFEFGEARAPDGKIAQQVRIIDADGVPWDALYTLEQEPDGSLRISGCVLIKAGQGCEAFSSESLPQARSVATGSRQGNASSNERAPRRELSSIRLSILA